MAQAESAKNDSNFAVVRGTSASVVPDAGFHVLILSPSSCLARCRSYRFCRLSRRSGPFPLSFPSRNAIVGVTGCFWQECHRASDATRRAAWRSPSWADPAPALSLRTEVRRGCIGALGARPPRTTRWARRSQCPEVRIMGCKSVLLRTLVAASRTLVLACPVLVPH